MYPVLREKEVLIRKYFSQKETPLFQLNTHIYEWQKYQMERVKESSMIDYSMYKYYTTVSEVLFPNQIQKKKMEKKKMNNDQMEIFDLFYMMSP
jgi:hypothetical protein